MRYCMDCAVEAARRQRARAPEINLAARRKWREKNRAQFQATQAAYRAAHREEINRKDRIRKARHREARRLERARCDAATA